MSLSSPRLRYITLSVIALIGLALSILLTQHFYEIRGVANHFKSSCNLSSTVNCDLVAASPSAELVGGLPVSSFAAAWFLNLFIMSFFFFRKHWEREAIRATFALSILGTFVSGLYFWIMRVQLHTFCLYCIGIDICVLLGFFITLSLKPDLNFNRSLNQGQWKTFLGIGAGSFLVMTLGLSALDPRWDQNGFQPASDQEMADSILNSKSIPVAIEPIDPSIGPKDAPITIVEFSDFQCPYCRMGAMEVNTLLYRYPGKIRVVFKNFPLDQKCNPESPQTMHPAACEAAKASLCSHEQGQFESAYENLFENQGSLAEGRVKDLLKNLQLDQTQFSTCMESAQPTLTISRDIQLGKSLGINATPTFFVNGHKVEGILPPSVWNQVIDRLLKRAN
jgi:hypothetical protein